MKCNVFLVGEEKRLIREEVDLDYYNIRQWRSLYLLLLESSTLSRLEIVPVYDDVI